MQATTTGRVGVIGTVGTIASGAYVARRRRPPVPPVDLTSRRAPASSSSSSAARPIGDEVTVLAERLLAPMREADVDALLLGCTHYPFLARVIGDVMGPDVDARVSSADETAFAARAPLGELGLLRARRRRGRPRTASCRAATSTGSASSAAACSGPSSTHAERWLPAD